jgi:hypothetical protein
MDLRTILFQPPAAAATYHTKIKEIQLILNFNAIDI